RPESQLVLFQNAVREQSQLQEAHLPSRQVVIRHRRMTAIAGESSSLLARRAPGKPTRGISAPSGVSVSGMRVCARTTQGGIRRIRSGGCAAIGPLARNRPSDPDASSSRQFTNPVTEAEAIRLAQAGDAAAFEFLYHLHGRRVYALC